MILKSKRLSISKCTVSEAPFYFELFNDPDWKHFINDKNLKTIAETKAYLKNVQIPPFSKSKLGVFTVYLSKTNTAIGVATLIKRDFLDTIDIGYAYLPKGRGKGFALEATQRMMQYLTQDLNVFKVAAIIKPNNQKSIQLVKKLGFQFVKRKAFYTEEEDLLYSYNLQ